MKRILVLATVVTLCLVGSGLMLAQSTDPFVGTWKMNVAKSKFTGTPALQSETLTIEAQGNAEKVSVEGIAGDGSRIAYSYTSNLDGKPALVSGSGVPNGADMYVVKRIDPNTRTVASMKAGKVVRTQRSVVSKDGKVLTLNNKGTGTDGQPTSTTTVWDKQ